MKEIVLPSGRFASIRPITWWDKVLCSNPSTDVLVMGIACRVVTIDGEPLTLEVAQQMEVAEANPIISLICEKLMAGYKSKGIA